MISNLAYIGIQIKEIIINVAKHIHFIQIRKIINIHSITTSHRWRNVSNRYKKHSDYFPGYSRNKIVTVFFLRLSVPSVIYKNICEACVRREWDTSWTSSRIHMSVLTTMHWSQLKGRLLWPNAEMFPEAREKHSCNHWSLKLILNIYVPLNYQWKEWTNEELQ